MIGRLGTGAGLGCMEQRNDSCLCRELNHSASVVQTIAQSPHWLSYPSSESMQNDVTLQENASPSCSPIGSLTSLLQQRVTDDGKWESWISVTKCFQVLLLLQCSSKHTMAHRGWSTKCHTEWRTKCHTIDCARNTFLLLQRHLTSGTELILIGWKIVPNEEHVQCDRRFASQPLANEPLHSS